MDGGMGGNYNVVNNYYKFGPSTSTGTANGVSRRHQVIRPDKQSAAPFLPYGRYYLSGNYVDGSVPITCNNWMGAAMAGGTLADTVLAKAETPFIIMPMPTQTAHETYKVVLQNAGCVLPVRDIIDQRIINDVINRSGAIIDVQGGFPHGTPYEQSKGAWPDLRCDSAPTDSDRDGMPDAWEINQGLNPNNASDRAGIAPNGYTNLENYLNGLTSTVLHVTPDAAWSSPLSGWPNPVSDLLHVAHPPKASGANLTIYNFVGKKLGVFACTPYINGTTINTAKLVKGNYLLVYRAPGLQLYYRFIKQ